jgi:hypothetical protein
VLQTFSLSTTCDSLHNDVAYGAQDGDQLTQRQRLLLLAKLMEVYELVGAPENLAFYCHGQGHSVGHESRQLAYGWLDVHLKPQGETFTPLLLPAGETPADDTRPPLDSHFARRLSSARRASA